MNRNDHRFQRSIQRSLVRGTDGPRGTVRLLGNDLGHPRRLLFVKTLRRERDYTEDGDPCALIEGDEILRVGASFHIGLTQSTRQLAPRIREREGLVFVGNEDLDQLSILPEPHAHVLRTTGRRLLL